MLIFPLAQIIRKRSLADLAIVVFIRCWFHCFAALLLGSAVAQSLKINLLGSMAGSFFLLVGLDIVRISQAARKWPDDRLTDTRSIKKLSVAVILLAPLPLLLGKGGGEILTWLAGMSWTIEVLSVFFYLIYFVLLLSVGRLPKAPVVLAWIVAIVASVLGFEGMEETYGKSGAKARQVERG